MSDIIDINLSEQEIKEREERIRKHKEKYTQDLVECINCKKILQRMGLAKHLRYWCPKLHIKELNVICPDCKRELKNDLCLRNHLDQNCRGVVDNNNYKQIKCEHCKDKCYSSLGSYYRHLKNKHPEKLIESTLQTEAQIEKIKLKRSIRLLQKKTNVPVPSSSAEPPREFYKPLINEDRLPTEEDPEIFEEE
jgi:hypothetical protein